MRIARCLSVIALAGLFIACDNTINNLNLYKSLWNPKNPQKPNG